MNIRSNRVWVWDQGVDMRKSYDGLYGIIRGHFDPLNGDVFLFLSKDRKRAKALYFDGTGLNIWQKRMERGRFADVFLRTEMTAAELEVFFLGSKEVTRRIVPREEKFSA